MGSSVTVLDKTTLLEHREKKTKIVETNLC